MRKHLNLLTIFLFLLSSLVLLPDTAPAQQRDHRLSDDMIEKIVESRLAKRGIMRGDKIDVEVDDGIVQLKGQVQSMAEKRWAERAARSVDDVMRVDNQLQVAGPRGSDQKIAEAVAKEIRGSVFYDIFDWVEGRVNNGVVTLQGAVREPWRKEDYARLAENVASVKEVQNEIKVLPNSSYDDQLRIATARLIYGDPRFVRYANRSLPPIHIIVENGRITLVGAVATQLEKQLAESLVRSSTLSFQVTNDLQVDNAMVRSER